VANNKLDLSSRSSEMISVNEDVPAGGDNRPIVKLSAAFQGIAAQRKVHDYGDSLPRSTNGHRESQRKG